MLILLVFDKISFYPSHVYIDTIKDKSLRWRFFLKKKQKLSYRCIFTENFKKTNEETINPSKEAEVNVAMFIIQHITFSNLPDHMSQYMRQEFNGSKAAEKNVE